MCFPEKAESGGRWSGEEGASFLSEVRGREWYHPPLEGGRHERTMDGKTRVWGHAALAWLISHQRLHWRNVVADLGDPGRSRWHRGKNLHRAGPGRADASVMLWLGDTSKSEPRGLRVASDHQESSADGERPCTRHLAKEL